jgi:hypothetical protein
MKQIPIIIPGQVYLHQDVRVNEYVVVTRNIQGDIYFSGNGIYGVNDRCVFLMRFAAVNPDDLTDNERNILTQYIGSGIKLSTGWVLEEGDIQELARLNAGWDSGDDDPDSEIDYEME